jgi:nucleoside-diphosphate-sugar epimerase
MRIAITGCTGRIGRCLTALALQQNHEITGFDQTDPPNDLAFLSHPSFRFFKADLQDYDTVLERLRGCDAVIQLAAFPSAGDYSAKIHNKCAASGSCSV